MNSDDPCETVLHRAPGILNAKLDLLLVLTAAVLLSTTGCGGAAGPERFPASGWVNVNGVPLEKGIIRFIPVSKPDGSGGGPAAVALVEAGAFEFTDADGPVAGPHRVEIEATGFAGFEIDDEAAFAAAAAKPGARPLASNPIPPAYNKQSTLERTIAVDSTNVFTFDLDVGSVPSRTN